MTANIADVFDVQSTFCQSKNHQKTHTSKTSQHLKQHTMGAQRLHFDDLLGPFGHPFFIKFRSHPNLLNCISSPSKIFLLHQTLEFWHRKSISKTRSRTHCFTFLFESMPKSSIWGPSSKSSGCKRAPQITQVAPKGSQKTSCALTFSRS